MPGLEEKDEITKIYCCCIKKTIHKGHPYSKISYSHFEETLKESYCENVPNTLSVGTAICVTGYIKPKCMRFSVDLISRKETSSDIAFHFNPRLDRHYVVRNARLGERWGMEEAASTMKCDITRCENFEIIFLVIDGQFLVSMNKKHFCSFKFRVPSNSITNIEVIGDVDVFNVEYKQLSIYPEIKPDEDQLIIGVGDEAEQPEKLLEIPCTGYLQKGFEVGWQLEIYGCIKLLPHSFYINLQDGVQLWPHPIIPLHLNPRFRSTDGENIMVRNSWSGGRWGTEERPPGFPFFPGETFNITIQKASDHFSVWINGMLTGEFKFRGPSDVNTVYIEGDIVLKKIVMYNKFTDIHKPVRDIIKL